MDWKEKVIVITGGTRGLGKALAKTFMSKGAKVVVGTHADGAQEQDGILAIKTDVTDEADVTHLAKETVKRFGRIDVWVNNAGIWLPPASIEEMDMGRVHNMVEVNLFGTMYGSKAALIQMRKQNSGVIINILSTSALEGRARSSGYGASKYAAAGFTKALRKEIEGTNVRAIAVYPGGMQTNLFDELRPDDYEKYMDPKIVAEKIVSNLEGNDFQEELIIRRPK